MKSRCQDSDENLRPSIQLFSAIWFKRLQWRLRCFAEGPWESGSTVATIGRSQQSLSLSSSQINRCRSKRSRRIHESDIYCPRRACRSIPRLAGPDLISPDPAMPIQSPPSLDALLYFLRASPRISDPSFSAATSRNSRNFGCFACSMTATASSTSF